MKKTKIHTVIRKIVREEVAAAINEVITELKQPSLSSKRVKSESKLEKKSFSSNSVLNDVLNETAKSEEWKSMGETYDSSKMNEVMSSQYGELLNNKTDNTVSVDGNTPEFLTKDYSKLVKKMNEQPRGKIEK